MCLLGGKLFYSRLDARSAFFQLPLDKKSRPLTAFTCAFGLYEFCALPMGLKSSPSLYQNFADKVLAGQDEFCLPYLDDWVVFSNSRTRHMTHLRQVLIRIKKANLKLKRLKCIFFKKSIEFLGYIVSQYGFSPAKSKVQAIIDMPPPTTVKETRGFLGAMNYYRRFILHFSQVAAPLTDLTKEPKIGQPPQEFQWSPACQQAFSAIKQALISAPILQPPS